MIKRKYIFFIGILFVITAMMIFPQSSTAFNADYEGNGNNVNLSLLEKGDVIVMRGVKKKADLIGGLFPGYWHHSAVYVGNGQMVEAWTDGVRTLGVSSTHTASEAAIYRVATSYWVKQAAVNFMLNQVGKPYDWGWLWWPGSKSVNSYYWYCSELNWAGYKKQGVDIDANPGYHWMFWNNVAPGELPDDGNTYYVDRDD